MRKRIISFFIVIIVIIVLLTVITIIIYNSKWAKEKSDDGWYQYTANDILDEEQPYTYVIHNESDFVDVEIDVNDIDGMIYIYVYKMGKNNGHIPQSISEIVTYPEVLYESIDEEGIYSYSIPEVSGYRHGIYIRLAGNSDYADITLKVYKWDNNWNALLYKIGIKKGYELDVEGVRTISE